MYLFDCLDWFDWFDPFDYVTDDLVFGVASVVAFLAIWAIFSPGTDLPSPGIFLLSKCEDGWVLVRSAPHHPYTLTFRVTQDGQPFKEFYPQWGFFQPDSLVGRSPEFKLRCTIDLASVQGMEILEGHNSDAVHAAMQREWDLSGAGQPEVQMPCNIYMALIRTFALEKNSLMYHMDGRANLNMHYKKTGLIIDAYLTVPVGDEAEAYNGFQLKRISKIFISLFLIMCSPEVKSLLKSCTSLANKVVETFNGK